MVLPKNSSVNMVSRVLGRLKCVDELSALFSDHISFFMTLMMFLIQLLHNTDRCAIMFMLKIDFC